MLQYFFCQFFHIFCCGIAIPKRNIAWSVLFSHNYDNPVDRIVFSTTFNYPFGHCVWLLWLPLWCVPLFAPVVSSLREKLWPYDCLLDSHVQSILCSGFRFDRSRQYSPVLSAPCTFPLNNVSVFYTYILRPSWLPYPTAREEAAGPQKLHCLQWT